MSPSWWAALTLHLIAGSHLTRAGIKPAPTVLRLWIARKSLPEGLVSCLSLVVRWHLAFGLHLTFDIYPLFSASQPYALCPALYAVYGLIFFAIFRTSAITRSRSTVRSSRFRMTTLPSMIASRTSAPRAA